MVKESTRIKMIGNMTEQDPLRMIPFTHTDENKI